MVIGDDDDAEIDMEFVSMNFPFFFLPKESKL